MTKKEFIKSVSKPYLDMHLEVMIANFVFYNYNKNKGLFGRYSQFWKDTTPIKSFQHKSKTYGEKLDYNEILNCSNWDDD